MKSLTRKEELVLLGILQLKDQAYLIAIHHHLSSISEKKLSLTSVHLPLSRLEKRGLIDSKYGQATAIRGGRRKKIYRLTPIGLAQLAEYKRINDKLWADYSELIVYQK